MPVYLFTYHSYRSWSPRNPRGFVQDVEEGIQPLSEPLAQAYDESAKHAAVLFDASIQRFLIEQSMDICQRGGGGGGGGG
ncbi:MAG: hypothetical protein WD534_12190, partial [Phycisphaeraceae bacterium]